MPHEVRYPIPPHRIPKYQLGNILVDRDWEDEYSIIVDVFCNSSGEVIYGHRDLSDMSRCMTTSETGIDQWYKKV